MLHVHSIVEDATITHPIAIKDKKTGKPKKGAVKFVREGDTVFARVRVARPICVETFEEFDQFGRFMLRDEGEPSPAVYQPFLCPASILNSTDMWAHLCDRCRQNPRHGYH